MKHLFSIWLLILSFNVFSESLTDPEKPVLHEVVKELDYVLDLIDKAERSRNRDVRFPVNYVQLKEDINQIRDALNRHLQAPRRTPRQLPPIEAEY